MIFLANREHFWESPFLLLNNFHGSNRILDIYCQRKSISLQDIEACWDMSHCKRSWWCWISNTRDPGWWFPKSRPRRPNKIRPFLPFWLRLLNWARCKRHKGDTSGRMVPAMLFQSPFFGANLCIAPLHLQNRRPKLRKRKWELQKNNRQMISQRTFKFLLLFILLWKGGKTSRFCQRILDVERLMLEAFPFENRTGCFCLLLNWII